MKILFFGNRKFVLEKLLEKSCNVEIGVIKNTHLEKDQILKINPFKLYETNDQVHERILKGDFDMLLSNGLPFRLKISDLPPRPYINIHPSFLPDLKGVDPVLGAVLFKRDAGATCHFMDESLDTGPIISQVKINYTNDLKASLLYQLSFLAEQMVFEKAWKRKFRILKHQKQSNKYIYFTRTSRTKYFSCDNSNNEICQIVKAFDNKNQGAYFCIEDQEFKCHDAWISSNPFLKRAYQSAINNSAVLAYEDTLVIKKDNKFLFLSKIAQSLFDLTGKKLK
jgi:methionyl-tRNA formyltransferase